MPRVLVAAVLGVVLLGAACASPLATSVELTLGGAASLKDALTEAATRYGASHGTVKLRLTFDASSAIRTQVEQGAPMDVFASADTANPQLLLDHGLAEGPIAVIARNQLVVVVPRSTVALVATPIDLARGGIKVVAAGPDVPITRYATQLVAQLAQLPGYPPDYAARVAANTVSREDNVRAIVAKVALGEADAGIVYATDARGANVGAIEIPAADNVIATYGGVTIKASHHPAEARAFLEWLAGADGQAVVAGFGFLPAKG